MPRTRSWCKLRDKAQKDKEKHDQVNEFMRQAESSRRRRDYNGGLCGRAAGPRNRSNEFDDRLAYNAILPKNPSRRRATAAKPLLDSARIEIVSRHYSQMHSICLERSSWSMPPIPNCLCWLAMPRLAWSRYGARRRSPSSKKRRRRPSALNSYSAGVKSIQEAISAMPSESACCVSTFGGPPDSGV